MVVVSCFPYSSLILHVGIGVCAFEEVVTSSNLHVCFAREKIFTSQASLGKEPAGRIHEGTGRASGWRGHWFSSAVRTELQSHLPFRGPIPSLLVIGRIDFLRL